MQVTERASSAAGIYQIIDAAPPTLSSIVRDLNDHGVMSHSAGDESAGGAAGAVDRAFRHGCDDKCIRGDDFSGLTEWSF